MVNRYFTYLKNSILVRTINLMLIFFVLQAGVLFYVMFHNQQELIEASYTNDLSTINLYMTNQIRVDHMMSLKLSEIDPNEIYETFREQGSDMSHYNSHTNILIIQENTILFNNSIGSISDYSQYLISLNPLLLSDIHVLENHIQTLNTFDNQVYTIDYLSNPLLPFRTLQYYKFYDTYVVFILDAYHYFNSNTRILEDDSDENYDFSNELKEVTLYDSNGQLLFYHKNNALQIPSPFELDVTKQSSFYFREDTQIVEFKYGRFQFINHYASILLNEVLALTLFACALVYYYFKKDVTLFRDIKKTLLGIENSQFQELRYLENKSFWMENQQLVQTFNHLIIESRRQFMNFSDSEAKLEHTRMILKDQEKHFEGLIGGFELANSKLKSVLQTNEQDYFTMLNAMANAIEAKDDYTRGHCERVMEVSLSIGVHLGLSEIQLKHLRYGATLHDIGKIGIHESILNKPYQLTDKERLLIEQHPVIGDVIISQLDYLEDAKSIVLYHHERYDGKGYPKGLSGKDIPTLARIVCIADAYDAMTSIRPYRSSAMSKEDALCELQRFSGQQFDPELVTILCRLIQEGGVN